MALKDGQRVKLAADLRLTGSVTLAEDASTGAVVGFLSLAAGTEGTVERVDRHPQEQSQEVREYVRLKSLLDDFGPQMPPGSRKQLEDQVGSLEPAWIVYQEHKLSVTVRVRLDNGFVLDDADETLFTS
ncbi:hypothetical protein ACFV9D_23845 [Streptomyces sp. NPDC059875]|uniref:hypothetical protein n=1 Tax=unclassified Streptomyces TaxID=2593676 RepID=UPI00365DD800